MRRLRSLAILALFCACTTSSTAVKESVRVKEPARPALAEINVTCSPVGSDLFPKGFAFVTEMGEPSCKDCLLMVDTVEYVCQESPQYCPCIQQAFFKNCNKYSESMREGCKPTKQVPVSGPLVQG